FALTTLLPSYKASVLLSKEVPPTSPTTTMYVKRDTNKKNNPIVVVKRIIPTFLRLFVGDNLFLVKYCFIFFIIGYFTFLKLPLWIDIPCFSAISRIRSLLDNSVLACSKRKISALSTTVCPSIIEISCSVCVMDVRK